MEDQEQTTGQAPSEETVQAILGYVQGQLSWTPDEEATAEVKSNIERHLKLAKKLQSVKLTNADEPDFIFRPWRAED